MRSALEKNGAKYRRTLVEDVEAYAEKWSSEGQQSWAVRRLQNRGEIKNKNKNGRGAVSVEY